MTDRTECPYCRQIVGATKAGRITKHKRPRIIQQNGQPRTINVECIGSGTESVE